MNGTEANRPRKGRLAAAYALITIGSLPGILTFFFVKDVLPEGLVHPARLVWVMFGVRMLVQAAASALVLTMLLLPTLGIIRRILTESEYKHFQVKVDEMETG